MRLIMDNLSLRGKDYETMPINGPFLGSFNDTAIIGHWGEGNKGTWTAAVGAGPSMQHLKIPESKTCTDTKTYFNNYKKENNHPEGVTMTTLLNLSYQQIQKYEQLKKNPDKPYTEAEIGQMEIELEKYNKIYQLMTTLMNQKDECSKAAIEGIKI